jgi:hypothetical protein
MERLNIELMLLVILQADSILKRPTE